MPNKIIRFPVKSTIAVAFLLSLSPVNRADAQQEPPEESSWTIPASWITPVEPFKIAERLYYVGTEQLSAFLFETDSGLILLDAPLEENVPKVVASIEKLGFSLHDVRYIIASHGHFDHVGGLASMQELTGAKVVLSERDAELVERGGRGDFFLKDTAAYSPVTADRVVAAGGAVRLGGLELTATLTAGHTRGCTSWSADVWVAGKKRKMVVVCSLSVLDGYQLAGEEESYPGIAKDFCQSVQTLRDMEADVYLASHPSFFAMKQKASSLDRNPEAFVDPKGLERYLVKAQEQIENTLKSQGANGGCAQVLR